MRPAKFTGRWIYPLLGFFAPLFLHATALAQCTRNCGTGGLAPDQLIFLYNFLGTPDGANPSAALWCKTLRETSLVRPRTLYASAGDGSTFAGWGGACASFETTSPCTLTTVDTDSSVTATFNTAVVTNYTLTLNCGPNMPVTSTELGTGTGDVTDNMTEINCGESGGQPVVGEMTCSASYPAGTVVALTASPTSPSTFGGWTGACTGTGACSVTMNSNQAVTADFIPPPASVNLHYEGLLFSLALWAIREFVGSMCWYLLR